MKITKQNIEKIRKHAEQTYPEECCGLVVMDGRKQIVIETENVHPDDRSQFFKIDSKVYLDCLEKYDSIACLYHSHPNGPSYFTHDDVAISEVLETPILMMEWPKGTHITYNPRYNGEMPYLQRPFVLGVLDCYTLIRDYYKREFKIELPALQVTYKWWDEGENLYLDNISKFGNQIRYWEKEMKPGDVILFQMAAKVPEHGAIYVGNNKILHHPIGKLSRHSLFGTFYRDRLHSVWRHKDLC